MVRVLRPVVDRHANLLADRGGITHAQHLGRHGRPACRIGHAEADRVAAGLVVALPGDGGRARIGLEGAVPVEVPLVVVDRVRGVVRGGRIERRRGGAAGGGRRGRGGGGGGGGY